MKQKATAPGGEAMKMCRLHLTMTKLDGTGNTGTIKNFFPLPYVSSCDGKFLNDQVQLIATVLCMFSSSTDVACRSVIECDGDVPWMVSNGIYIWWFLCFPPLQTTNINHHRTAAWHLTASSIGCTWISAACYAVNVYRIWGR